MKVFYFLTKSEQGGAQTVVYELVCAHKQRGDDVIVMAQGQGWLADKTREIGYRYIENSFVKKTFNPFVLLKSGSAYRKAVKAFRPDIVSIHNSFSGIIGRIFRVNGTHVIYTAHGWGVSYSGGMKKYLGILGEKIATLFCDAIVCVSYSDRDIALRFRIAPKDKITVIHNGVDVSKFASGDKRQAIAFMGRFAWPKCQDVLVDAFGLLPDDIRESTSLVFIGGGPGELNLKKKVTSLGLEKSVQFKGTLPREEALKVLSNCSISVLISHSEGFPMSIIESLQLGVPVVANDVGGVKEAVDDTVGRLLISRPDAGILAGSLRELLSDSKTLKSLSSRAKDRGANFSTTSMSRKTFSLYESIS